MTTTTRSSVAAPPPGEHESLLRALRAVLADRERELLALKGPCSSEQCRLHYAHSGPCDVKERSA